MNAAGLLIALVTFGLGPVGSESSVDSVTLRDGKVVLGQLLDSDRRGPQLMLVRRVWAESNLPDKFAAWEKVEAPQARKAENQRRERLHAWRRDRKEYPGGVDRITSWIDRELTRLSGHGQNAKSTLMIAKFSRTEIKSVDRKSKRDNRMLRLGWLSNLLDVEVMSRHNLAQALEGRGFSVDVDTPVSVDPLLPVPLETEAQWLVHRAATEVLNDPGSRLLRYQGMVIPESAAGERPPAGASLNVALGTIKDLLGEAPVDPLPGKLRELAGQGRVGVVVTRLELAADFSSVAVETTLWTRGGERWIPAVVRSATVRPDDLPANAGDGLADDPQVKAAFGVVEAFGLGEVSPDLKRRSLNMGAATQKALGQARGALDQDLNSLGLSLEAPRERTPSPRP